MIGVVLRRGGGSRVYLEGMFISFGVEGVGKVFLGREEGRCLFSV